jgi:hypothetical protein
MNADELKTECEHRQIPVRVDGVITASGLAVLLEYSVDTVRKWRDGDGGEWHEGNPGPRWRIAPWRGHRYTYRLADVAAWLNREAMRAAAE